MADDDRPHDPTPLTIETRAEDGGRVVELDGERDHASSEAFDDAMRRAEEGPPDWILIDLERVQFIDSTGLRTLLAVKRRADNAPYRLTLTRGTGYVADMFRLTALDQTLPFADRSAG